MRTILLLLIFLALTLTGCSAPEFAAQSGGYWVSFYPESAQKHSEGGRYQGEFHGLWTWWGPEGEIVEQRRFDRGEAVDIRDRAPWWPRASAQSR